MNSTFIFKSRISFFETLEKIKFSADLAAISESSSSSWSVKFSQLPNPGGAPDPCIAS